VKPDLSAASACYKFETPLTCYVEVHIIRRNNPLMTREPSSGLGHPRATSCVFPEPCSAKWVTRFSWPKWARAPSEDGKDAERLWRRNGASDQGKLSGKRLSQAILSVMRRQSTCARRI